MALDTGGMMGDIRGMMGDTGGMMGDIRGMAIDTCGMTGDIFEASDSVTYPEIA
jgi:hypothetical protein